MSQPAKPYRIVDFDQLEAVRCPGGGARGALVDEPAFPGSIHRTQIQCDAKLHYHQRLTETYYFLQCGPDARMQLDDDIVAVKPGLCILIPPGVRHRAIGPMTVLIVVFPAFDPKDEVIVDQEPN
jgi:mannose-6-phosphate isomerase-like protein (cupin superfamily)